MSVPSRDIPSRLKAEAALAELTEFPGMAARADSRGDPCGLRFAFGTSTGLPTGYIGDEKAVLGVVGVPVGGYSGVPTVVDTFSFGSFPERAE